MSDATGIAPVVAGKTSVGSGPLERVDDVRCGAHAVATIAVASSSQPIVIINSIRRFGCGNGSVSGGVEVDDALLCSAGFLAFRKGRVRLGAQELSEESRRKSSKETEEGINQSAHGA